MKRYVRRNLGHSAAGNLYVRARAKRRSGERLRVSCYISDFTNYETGTTEEQDHNNECLKIERNTIYHGSCPCQVSKFANISRFAHSSDYRSAVDCLILPIPPCLLRPQFQFIEDRLGELIDIFVSYIPQVCHN
jgi:hypothetical protein